MRGARKPRRSRRPPGVVAEEFLNSQPYPVLDHKSNLLRRLRSLKAARMMLYLSLYII